MAVSKNGGATAATHVNMMTDTIIANLPADGLRVVMRSLLASCPEVTGTFEHETRCFLRHAAATSVGTKIDTVDIDGLKQAQQIVRCMLGSGVPFQSIPLLKDMVVRGADLALEPSVGSELESFLASVDSDIVQAMTAVKKTLFTNTGVRVMSTTEYALIETLFESLIRCQGILQSTGREYPYGRGLVTTASTLGVPQPAAQDAVSFRRALQQPFPHTAKETFVLGDRILPRIFSGLWQMSSAAWGSAPTSKIFEQFSTHVQTGFTAFDMADHYGDAEVIFGRFCERCQRLQQDKIDLLQFHWQFWDDPGYLDALRYLQEDRRVGMIGLCNFNTEHLLRAIESGVHVHTNQVQFSLIDSRPVEKMGEACKRHGVKLLTYGTLCGGFLAEKWLNKPEPDVYSASITPSQRKYHGIISNWGGWELFQRLLRTLDGIAKRRDVTISNVATRWVLDFPYVGAVIIGARMGVSEHTSDNQATFGWSLDDQDRAAIEEVLEKSNRKEVFKTMGDCGGEYRTIG
ncbi:hypothetical protein CEP52_010438 [Fusarium oligoseptatum]|uniref:NADP-dependent oxidoreductase domain-containing protein n=1 Tax=Fusarium oligoseptatum TaxID=2604345 RepID=A0A428T878_9HYPO|nr:hypothetical protein CEP52_010438 [Fusarium oligoseptatum]